MHEGGLLVMKREESAEKARRLIEPLANFLIRPFADGSKALTNRRIGPSYLDQIFWQVGSSAMCLVRSVEDQSG
jgi:hypothetical protein